MTAFKHGSKPVVGLIGAIGAGKSTVAKLLALRGGHVIDADALGHDALRQPEIVSELVNRWGERIRKADGTLDRHAIGSIVFSNPDERNALEATVYPYIGERTLQEIAAAQVNPAAAFVVLDAAVQLEAGWAEMVDRLLYIDAPREERVKRLAVRSNWTESELAAREAAQWPAERKKALANAILVNDGDAGELARRVDQLVRDWGIARL
jgi:dephospho-CoA kinase